MPARGSDFQSKAGGVLTFDIDEIGQFGVFRRPLRDLAGGLRQGFDAVQMGGDFAQRARAVNGNAAHHGGLFCVFLRQDERAPRLHTLPCHRQRAAHGAQHAGKRQFAGKLVLRELFGCDLSGCGKDAQRNRQVETSRFFGQVGGGEVDGDFFGREVETALDDGGSYAVAAFFDFGVGQSDDIEMRQASTSTNGAFMPLKARL